MVNKWLNNNLLRIFPVQCLVCGESCMEMALCPDCEKGLKLNLHTCRRCAEPLTDNYQNSLCGKCLKQLPAFDHVISPYLYQAPIDKLVTRFKYRADHTAGHVLARLLGQYLHKVDAEKPGCLVPVPLHASRLRQRGFNQSQEICRALGRQLGIPVEATDCQRQRKTTSQSGLNEKQRRKNIRGAFLVKEKLPYRHVAIVDDVMTTGNTVNELAKVLRKAGVEKIQVWTVCRAASWK